MRLLALCLLSFSTLACNASAAPLEIYILGDMEKPTAEQKINHAPDFFKDGAITLHAARNEVVAFQIVLRVTEPQQGMDITATDLTGPATLPAEPNIQFFLAHYEMPKNASYNWGPNGGAGALPWRFKQWPDALIPFRDPYDNSRAAVGAPFNLDPTQRLNQAVWVDFLVPKESPAGEYTGTVIIKRGEEVFQSLPLRLTVHDFALPDEAHVDAFGELYGGNGLFFDSRTLTGGRLGYDELIYLRYQQMAHAHRFIATLRMQESPLPMTSLRAPANVLEKAFAGDWAAYLHSVQPILDGKLFTSAHDYVGPRVGASPAFFPAPFPQQFSGNALAHYLWQHGGKLDPQLLATVEHNAAAFWSRMQTLGWSDKRFFTYIFDEVAGSVDTGEAGGGGARKMDDIHAAMRDLQTALDKGAGGPHIDLIWTSHADAAQYAGTPLDLSDTIRWWAPNAHGLNLDYYREQLKKPGRRVWFYHSGQPAVGNHTINQLGIDLRLWGLLCRRYGLSGSFWWSMMLFPKGPGEEGFNPYANPSYKFEDTRWGNGVLFYPGSRLTMIGGHKNIEGPVASMRMKAYRRGLQDYEYCWLADQAGQTAAVDGLLKDLIPTAFSEAPKGAVPGTWSHTPADYYALRRHLAEVISKSENAAVE